MYRSFCMRVIPILCQIQAYKGAGGATKNNFFKIWPIIKKRYIFQLLQTFPNKILAIGIFNVIDVCHFKNSCIFGIHLVTKIIIKVVMIISVTITVAVVITRLIGSIIVVEIVMILIRFLFVIVINVTILIFVPSSTATMALDRFS